MAAAYMLIGPFIGFQQTPHLPLKTANPFPIEPMADRFASSSSEAFSDSPSPIFSVQPVSSLSARNMPPIGRL